MKSTPLELYDPTTLKIARILLVSGEMDRHELDTICGTSTKASYYLRRHKHMFKVIRRPYKKTVQRYIRPILSRTEETAFSKLLEALDPSGEAFRQYKSNMWDHGRLTNDESKSYRNASIAHSVALFYDFFDIDIWNRPTLKEYANEGATLPQNTFFSTSEIKWYANENSKDFEYRNSISTGTLMCENGTYVIYSLRKPPKSKVIWCEGVEERYMKQVENVFKDAECPKKNKKVDKMLIMAREDIALSICRAILSSKKDEGLNLPTDINTAIYLPHGESGKEIIKLLSIPNYLKKLKDHYIPEKTYQLQSVTEDGYIEDYIYDEEGKPQKDDNGNLLMEMKELLIWYDNDLNRLCKALYKTTRKYKKLMIYCLESQYTLLTKILKLSENTEIEISISTENIEDIIRHITTREEDRKCS